jgi:hypothetical protein
MLDLELQIFIEVVDAGGLTPAAHRLVLSKSIVSRRLARLEDELGAQLLVRTTRGIGVTEAGATFREHAVGVAAARGPFVAVAIASIAKLSGSSNSSRSTMTACPLRSGSLADSFSAARSKVGEG